MGGRLSGWSGVTEALDSRSPPLCVVGSRLCKEKDSFIPAGRNVIICVTDDTLPEEALPAFVFILILWADYSAASWRVYFIHCLESSFTAVAHCLFFIFFPAAVVAFETDWRECALNLSPYFPVTQLIHSQ